MVIELICVDFHILIQHIELDMKFVRRAWHLSPAQSGYRPSNIWLCSSSLAKNRAVVVLEVLLLFGLLLRLIQFHAAFVVLLPNLLHTQFLFLVHDGRIYDITFLLRGLYFPNRDIQVCILSSVWHRILLLLLIFFW